MGYYSEYLNRPFNNFQELCNERKAQLKNISRLRNGSDIIVMASDLTVAIPENSINCSDLLPLEDLLSDLKGNKLDLIIETPGGSGEIAEEIVRILRNRYDFIGVIIPGHAMSAGTLITMAADEILMDEFSAVGPIDAQIRWQGKVFSAEALIKGFEGVKKEVDATGVLSKAYIPILQSISLGELENARNQLDFAKDLVRDWLVQYKFRNWVHSSGQPATEEEKIATAEHIAKELGKHSEWKTHGRCIKIENLRHLGLRITDFSSDPALCEAVRRYNTLLHMTFENTNMYKLFETAEGQIYRFVAQNVPVPAKLDPRQADSAELDVTCSKCQRQFKVQVNLKKGIPVQNGRLPYPKNDKLKCSGCQADIDLTAARQQIEAQSGRQVIKG